MIGHWGFIHRLRFLKGHSCYIMEEGGYWGIWEVVLRFRQWEHPQDNCKWFRNQISFTLGYLFWQSEAIQKIISRSLPLCLAWLDTSCDDFPELQLVESAKGICVTSGELLLIHYSSSVPPLACRHFLFQVGWGVGQKYVWNVHFKILKCFLLKFRNIDIVTQRVEPNNISTLKWNKSQLQKCKTHSWKDLFSCQCLLGVWGGGSDCPLQGEVLGSQVFRMRPTQESTRWPVLDTWGTEAG